MSQEKQAQGNSGNKDQFVPKQGNAGGRRRLRVMVAGRAEDIVRRIDRNLARNEFLDCRLRLVTNGHADPLHSVVELPDALVFVLSDGWQEELESLAGRPVTSRPPAIIIGPVDNVDAVRLAMRAGARDYFNLPEDIAEIEKILADIAAESIRPDEEESASIISVINAKGGSGATFIATSLAQILMMRLQRKTALLDLELQFGSIADYMDIEIKHGLAEVFQVAYELDDVALQSYMTADQSGVHVLGTRVGGLQLGAEIDEEKFFKILTLLSSCFQHVVIDSPRHLDNLTIQAIEQSTSILVVVQQNLASLKDATRLLAVLRNELAINDMRIKIVVNRFDKNAEITDQDICRALCINSVSIVPNDFAKVNDSLNTGVPIYRSFKSAQITKALINLANDLAGQHDKYKPSLLDIAITGIRGVLDSHARNRT